LFLDRLARDMLKPVSRGVTVLVSLYTSLWGLWLLSPFWTVFTTGTLYSGLQSFAPEWFWGLFALGCGLAALFTALTDHFPVSAFTTAALVGWHWLIVGILYLYGDWHNTGGITGIFLAILCAYIYFSVKANRGYK
jgi:hypothetical protein